MSTSLQVFVKLARQSLAANVAGISPSRHLHVTDKSSNLFFLVDTGATVNILPKSSCTGYKPYQSDRPLHAVNHSSIPTYGEKFIFLAISKTLL